ncbi:MAG: hypothetical protein IPG60_06720 [Bacteroidetes bacterium]|nr:hypothetical protein [Bacteroidota bacterium]
MKPSIFTLPHPYPFGMLTPGRNWSTGSEYRFGFNGQEQDDEIKVLEIAITFCLEFMIHV